MIVVDRSVIGREMTDDYSGHLFFQLELALHQMGLGKIKLKTPIQRNIETACPK